MGMMEGIGKRVDGSSLLWRLADYTDLVKRGSDGTAKVIERIETPYNEFGIVDRKTLFRRLLGSIASDYRWQGHYEGPHHLMWSRTDYRLPNVHPAQVETFSRFRGSPTLKVRLPRELHDWLHRVTEPPTPPSLDVMRQYVHEQGQVHRLYNTVSLSRYNFEGLSFEEKEKLRHDGLLRKLEEMSDGELGIMPEKERLAAMGLIAARRLLRHRTHPLGLSGSATCQKVFFSEDTP